MTKSDIRKTRKDLYAPTATQFVQVDVPEMGFVMVDGHGNPNSSADYKRAVEWLYSVSYGVKFAAKSLGHDYVVPPLEGLWWADDMNDFITRAKDKWRWTMMIHAPDIVSAEMFKAARAKAEAKLGAPPGSLRLERFREGRCLQIMHIGSYDEEGPVLDRLHNQVMPELGLTYGGKHHEIYIGDPRKAAPAKLKTVLRQPVKPLSEET